MKVILLQDVKSLGKEGEIVNVNDGYARNFIIPKKLGVEANSKNMNDLKLKKNNEEKIAKENKEAAEKLAGELKAGQVALKIKVGEGGKAFGQGPDGPGRGQKEDPAQGNAENIGNTYSSGEAASGSDRGIEGRDRGRGIMNTHGRSYRL